MSNTTSKPTGEVGSSAKNTMVAQNTTQSLNKQASETVSPTGNEAKVVSTNFTEAFAKTIEQLNKTLANFKGEIVGKITVEPQGKLEEVLKINPKELVKKSTLIADNDAANRNRISGTP